MGKVKSQLVVPLHIGNIPKLTFVSLNLLLDEPFPQYIIYIMTSEYKNRLYRAIDNLTYPKVTFLNDPNVVSFP